MMETAQTLLAFWFGTDADDARVAHVQSALWWRKDAATDAAMRERFAGLLALATHRNRILGRVSTPGETAFLLEKGSSF